MSAADTTQQSGDFLQQSFRDDEVEPDDVPIPVQQWLPQQFKVVEYFYTQIFSFVQLYLCES